MIKYPLILISLTLMQAQASERADCYINVLESLHSEEAEQHFAEPFDQYASNLCYAHVAADILSFHTGRSVSPIALSVETHNSTNGPWSPGNGGEIVNALDFAAGENHAACLNSGFSSRLSQNEYADLAHLTRGAVENSCRAHQAALPKLSMKFYRNCGGVPTLPESFKAMMLSALDVELNQHCPVGVSIHLRPIAKDLASAGRLGIPDGVPDVHAVTVVGKTWNEEQNRCEYVLRNSFGRDGCGGLLDSEKVGCVSPRGFPTGVFTVTEEKFREVLHRMVMLEAIQGEQGSNVEVLRPDCSGEAVASDGKLPSGDVSAQKPKLVERQKPPGREKPPTKRKFISASPGSLFQKN